MLTKAFIPRAVWKLVYDCCMNVYCPTNSAAFSHWSKWLHQFTANVKEKCSVRTLFILKSERYLSNIQPYMEYKAQLSLYPTDTRKYHIKVANIATSAVLSWLGMLLNDFYGNVRACFIYALLKHLGPTSLLLLKTWDVYKEALSWLLNDSTRWRSEHQNFTFRSDIMTQFTEILWSSSAEQTE